MITATENVFVIEIDDFRFDEYTEGIAFAAVRVKHALFWSLAIGAGIGLALSYVAPGMMGRPAVWLVLFFGAYAYMGWSSWASRSAMYDRYRANARSTYSIGPEGVVGKCAVCRHEYKWAAIARYRKTAHAFTLVLKSCGVLILPRRLIEDEAALETFLASHIS